MEVEVRTEPLRGGPMSELSMGRPERVGPLDLLVIQPTPFCNIDCSYCYLPTRQSKERMAPRCWTPSSSASLPAAL